MNKLQLSYLELLKKVLIDLDRVKYSEYLPVEGRIAKVINWFLKNTRFYHKQNAYVCNKVEYSYEKRMNGEDWPLYADSMIGYKRMSNVQNCMIDVIQNNIPGDFIETGVWRGGTVIFMAAILKAFEITDRKVWVADSFEGLPKPNEEKYEADKGDKHYVFNELKVSLENVMDNFRKYDLLGDNVKFLKGWFSETLPTAPIEKLAVLRLDGDMYESTMDGLVNLYPKLSVGGYCIIDDWNAVVACKKAVNDYIQQHNITAEIITIDNIAVYWKKS